ncbi:MAG: hypothetical protein ACYCOR_13730 [Acidobacteriaceae bacterium]
MNPAYLHWLAQAASRHAANQSLPVFVRRHWAHMATGWLRRAQIAERIQLRPNHPESPDSWYHLSDPGAVYLL